MDSILNPLDIVAGQTAIEVGCNLLLASVAMIITTALIGFWMTVLLMFMGWIIQLLSAFVLPYIGSRIPDDAVAAVGTKVCGATSWVAGLFGKKVAA